MIVRLETIHAESTDSYEQKKMKQVAALTSEYCEPDNCFSLNKECNPFGKTRSMQNVENLTRVDAVRRGSDSYATGENYWWRREKKGIEEAIVIRAVSPPRARNHFHRSSFAGKDYGESTKGDVDLDVTGRSNYSGAGRYSKLISTTIRSAAFALPVAGSGRYRGTYNR